MLIPRDIAPALVVETLSGTPYDLSPLASPSSAFIVACIVLSVRITLGN